MLYKVLQATRETPIKNDFVKTCEPYLKQLNMNMTFEELSKMSKWRVKQLVKSKSCLLLFDKVKEQTKQKYRTHSTEIYECRNIYLRVIKILKCKS